MRAEEESEWNSENRFNEKIKKDKIQKKNKYNETERQSVRICTCAPARVIEKPAGKIHSGENLKESKRWRREEIIGIILRE